MPAIFKTFEEARKDLLAQGFWKKDKDDGYLDLCARMLVFLCDTNRFETALASVSKFIWSYYTGLPAAAKNKFSRALAHVATQNMFRVSTRPGQAPHPNLLQGQPAPSPGPLDIKLIASYGDFFGLLRDRMFWKDSMDMQHGEYSHALQWLALASEFGPRAGTFYSKLPEYWNKGRNIPLWSYLADCFPEGMKASPELTSNTYRSPQIITRYLIGSAQPLQDHFVSHYLTYVYRQRGLLNYVKTKQDGIKAKYGDASGYAQDPSRLNKWVSHTETGKDGATPQLTRLDRNPQAARDRATKQIGVEVRFHDIPGTLWTAGDGKNLTLNQAEI